MAEPGAGLNRDILKNLRLARQASRALEASGFPLALWEAYALAHTDPAALKREVRRLDAPGGPPGDVHAELLSSLRVLRDRTAPTLRRLHRFLPAEDLELQEMILAFVATSAPALEAAARWVDAPGEFREEAARKIRLMETIVRRYRADLDRAGGKTPPSALPQVPERGLPPPADFSAAAGQGEVSLSWQPVPGAASYVVKRAIAPEGPFAPVARPTAPAFVDTGLTNGRTYTYHACALDAEGLEGRASRAASATPLVPPSAPAGLGATAGNARVTLTWVAVDGASSYVVRRASGPQGPFSSAGTVPSPSFFDTNLSNGTTYFYTVSASNAAGESPSSEPVRATPVAPPGAPTGLAAQPGHGRVSLSWDPMPGVLTYRVMRSTSPGGPYSSLANPTGASYVDEAVSNGTTYYYVVRTMNAGGKGPFSAEVRAAPAAPAPAPTGLSAAPGHSQVFLSWSAAPGAASYTVKRGPGPEGPFTPIAAPGTTSYVDSTVANGTAYAYVVSATNAGGESADSAPVVATPVAPPNAPDGVRASAGNGQITLSWNPVPRAAAYAIRRASSPGGPFSAVASCGAPPWTDTGLANGATYYYAVSASNPGGESPSSEPVPASPIGPPLPPGSLTASPGPARVSLVWTPIARATGYAVRRAPSPGGPWTEIARTESSSHVDSDVANGSTYFYAVAALNAGGAGDSTAPVAATPVAPPPAPTGLAALPGDGRVSLSWSPSPRAAGYVVRRAATPGGPYTTVATVAAPAFADTGLANGAACHYVVAAVNAGGESAPSLPAQASPVAPPPPPSGLEAVPGNARIALKWSPSPGATGYNVRRSTSRGGPYVTIASPSEALYEDRELRNGTSYFFMVTALNAGGESPASGEVQAQPAGPPPPPASLSVHAGNAQVVLSWKPVEGAQRYRVKRGTTPAGPFTAIAETEHASTVDASVANGTPYAYTVSSVNLGGEGPDSSPVVALPLAPPPAPTGLIAVPGNARVSLSWNPAPRAARYSVRRLAFPSGPFRPAAECKTESFTDTNLVNGTTYSYVVLASNVGGESPPSAPATATPVAPPAPPEGLAATPGDGQVHLAWSASPGAVGYHVKRATSVEGPYAPIAATGDLSWIDATVANGTTFFYTASAVNAGGESADSAPAEAMPVAPPPAPERFEVRPGDAQVTLSWAPAERAARYLVRRATNPAGPFAEIGAPPQPAFVDRAVTNGTTYFYRVEAENAGGASPRTAPVQATPVEPPPVPAGFTATPGNAQVTLAWSAAPRAAGYRVRRAGQFKGPYATVAETQATSFVDTGVRNGETYFYFVVAHNAGGESARCSRKQAAPVAPPPTPERPAAFAGNGQVEVAWEPSPGAARYRVRRAAERRGPYVPVAIESGTSWVDRAVVNGTPYYYIITALNAGGKSAHTAPVQATPQAPPAAPARVEAAAGDGRVTLSWAACASAASYRVMKSDSPGGPYTLLSSPAATTFVDTPLQNGRTCHYVITAVNAGGESGRSEEAAATPVAPPAVPTGLEAEAGDCRVTLSWTPVATASGYTVKRATLPGGPYLPVGRPAEPRYVDSGVVNGKPFYYVVTATNGSGESADSILVPAVPEDTSGPAPSTPRTPFPPAEERGEAPLAVPVAPDGNGASAAAGEDDVPALESLKVPAVGTLPVGVDLERLLDLRRVGELRAIFDGTAQRIEPWEVLCLITTEGFAARRELERLVQLRDKGDEGRLHEGALSFFDKILRVRSEHGGLARRLAGYVEGLDLAPSGPEALEIALGFILSAPRGRLRAGRWLDDPEGQRGAARTYLEHALEIARKYHRQLAAR
jgi:fibronectin type 3 domain-containing protein